MEIITSINFSPNSVSNEMTKMIHNTIAVVVPT
jgi:hypothetical protein